MIFYTENNYLKQHDVDVRRHRTARR